MPLLLNSPLKEPLQSLLLMRLHPDKVGAAPWGPQHQCGHCSPTRPDERRNYKMATRLVIRMHRTSFHETN